MHCTTLPDDTALAEAAAARVATLARAAIGERGRFTLALSGGGTPRAMLRQLAGHPLEWSRVHVFQVDERDAPDGSETRNWTHLCRELLDRVGLPAAGRHPMPVGTPDADQRYARELEVICAAPPALDLVQLGLGTDGHTASLVPDDDVLDVWDRDVAWTATDYQGTRRLTLTWPCLARARRVLWLVAGAEKREMVARLRAADATIPAGRVSQEHAELWVDRAAAASA